MSEDTKIVAAALDSRTAFGLVTHHLEPADLGPQAEAWWPVIEDWYARDLDASMVDWDVLRSTGERNLPAAHKENLLGWFDALEPVASPANIAQDVLDLKRTQKARELATQLIAGKRAGDLLEQYTALEAATDLESTNADGYWAEEDLATLIAGSQPENLIPVFPKALRNVCAGGVEPGDHIVLFARPEVGKSLFAINMASGWARTGLKVLYVGNEDPIDKLKRRLLCNLANCTMEQARKYPEKAQERAQANGLANVKMWWQAGMTLGHLEKLVREVTPDCVVIDQLRGLRGTETGMTSKLEEVAIGFRQLLGKYKLVGLSTNQGNDRTERHGQEPPAWLKMGDVADSRTGLPGQADLLLGVGADGDMHERHERACSILKNKGEGSHEGFKFWVDTARSKIR